MKKSLEENRKVQAPPPKQPLLPRRCAAGPDGSQIEQNQFLDYERHGKLQLGGFTTAGMGHRQLKKNPNVRMLCHERWQRAPKASSGGC